MVPAVAASITRVGVVGLFCKFLNGINRRENDDGQAVMVFVVANAIQQHAVFLVSKAVRRHKR